MKNLHNNTLMHIIDCLRHNHDGEIPHERKTLTIRDLQMLNEHDKNIARNICNFDDNIGEHHEGYCRIALWMLKFIKYGEFVYASSYDSSKIKKICIDEDFFKNRKDLNKYFYFKEMNKFEKWMKNEQSHQDS